MTMIRKIGKVLLRFQILGYIPMVRYAETSIAMILNVAESLKVAVYRSWWTLLVRTVMLIVPALPDMLVSGAVSIIFQNIGVNH